MTVLATALPTHVSARAAKAAIASLPLLPFEAIFGKRPILVLAPHQDDESLGCGGTLAEAVARGVPAHVAFLTDGGASHPSSATWPRHRLVAERRAEALRAVALLGLRADAVAFLDEPDGAAPHDGPAFDAVLDRLCVLLRRWGVGTVCATWIGDPHGDHGAAAKLATAAAAHVGARHLAYPIWAWTVPDEHTLPAVPGGARLGVASYRDLKRRAVGAHATQHAGTITDDPHGFALPAEFLAMLDRDWEAFITPDGAGP